MRRPGPSFNDIKTILLRLAESKPDDSTERIVSTYMTASAFYDKKAPWRGGDSEWECVGPTFLFQLLPQESQAPKNFLQILCLLVLTGLSIPLIC